MVKNGAAKNEERRKKRTSEVMQAEDADQPKTKEGQLEALKKDRGACAAQIEKLEKGCLELDAEIETKSKEVAQAKAKKNGERKDFAKRAELADKVERLQDEEKALTSEREKMKDQIIAMQKEEKELTAEINLIKSDVLAFTGTAEDALAKTPLRDLDKQLVAHTKFSRTGVPTFNFEPTKVFKLPVETFLETCKEVDAVKTALAEKVDYLMDIAGVRNMMKHAANGNENSAVRAVESVFAELIEFLSQLGIDGLKYAHNDSGIDVVVFHEKEDNALAKGGTDNVREDWLTCEVKMPFRASKRAAKGKKPAAAASSTSSTSTSTSGSAPGTAELYEQYCELIEDPNAPGKFVCACGVDYSDLSKCKRDGGENKSKEGSECQTERGQKCSVIRQIYNYMCSRGDLVSLYSTYNQWAVFVRDCEGNLGITPLVTYDSTSPTVPLLLMVVLLIAHANELPEALYNRDGVKGKLVKCQGEGDECDKRTHDGPDKPSMPSARTREGSTRRKHGVADCAARGDGQRKDSALPLYLDLGVTEDLPRGRTGETKRVSLPRGAHKERVDSVIKMVDLFKQPHIKDELDHEALVYERLMDLQGAEVPRLVACGHLQDGFLYGLATEYAGASVVDEPQEDAAKDAFVEAAREALRAIHSKGVLHGDIKRENVLVRGDGRPVIIDFGAASLLPESDGMPAQASREMELAQLEACLRE